ncbi:MAG: helix-turn-helix domain-containing protein [Nitriliruptorales bacterium]|nr:helix-turn-helix domain-containing protein [Nitriliruptorales bacterium]
MAAPPSKLLARARAADEHADETRTRIVDAARDVFGSTGFRRATMDDVATAAGFGRATVYRKFENKEALVEAVFLDELNDYFAAIDEATERLDTFEEQVVEGFMVTLRAIQASTTMGRLLEIEGDWGLSYVTVLMTPVIAASREFIASKIRAAQSRGDAAEDVDPELAAEVIVRLCHSLLLTPEGAIPHDDSGAARDFARDYLVPIVRHR